MGIPAEHKAKIIENYLKKGNFFFKGGFNKKDLKVLDKKFPVLKSYHVRCSDEELLRRIAAFILLKWGRKEYKAIDAPQLFAFSDDSDSKEDNVTYSDLKIIPLVIFTLLPGNGISTSKSFKFIESKILDMLEFRERVGLPSLVLTYKKLSAIDKKFPEVYFSSKNDDKRIVLPDGRRLKSEDPVL